MNDKPKRLSLEMFEDKPTGIPVSQEMIQKAIAKFGKRMEEKQMRNIHKGHWLSCQDDYLVRRILTELAELMEAIEYGDDMEVIYECADVANFACMLADKRERKIPGYE